MSDQPQLMDNAQRDIGTNDANDVIQVGFWYYFMQAIMDAREEKARLDALAKTRPLKESDLKTFDRMRGKLSTLPSDLINAKDEAEMAEIARAALVDRP